MIRVLLQAEKYYTYSDLNTAFLDFCFSNFYFVSILECDSDVLLYYVYCRYLGDRVYSFQDRFLTLIIILCPPIITYTPASSHLTEIITDTPNIQQTNISSDFYKYFPGSQDLFFARTGQYMIM